MKEENESDKERKKISKFKYIQAFLSVMFIPLGWLLMIYVVVIGFTKTNDLNDFDKIISIIGISCIIIIVVVATWFGMLDIKNLIEERKKIK